MGQYKSQYTGPQIDAGVGAALNPDLVPKEGSDALITSDAVAKVQQGFAPIETAATSANSYAIGDLLVWGGVLYKAKTSITAGDSFVVDTNIEATTIANKLNNIDTEITSNTDTTLTGLLTGNGSKVGTKSLDTSSLTNDADHVPVSSVVKSALDAKADKNDLATIHQTSPTCTETNGIAAGVFFYLDNELVVAKTAIANGATFTNGTNYESPTAGGLNALKSAIAVVQTTTMTTPTATGSAGRVSKQVTVPSGKICVPLSFTVEHKTNGNQYSYGAAEIPGNYVCIWDSLDGIRIQLDLQGMVTAFGGQTAIVTYMVV